MLYRTRDKYPWLEMQTLYPFSVEGIGRAASGRDGDEDGEIDHRAVAAIGGMN
jgi:hypothetical protein